MALTKDNWRQLLRPEAWRRLPPNVYVALVTQLFRISPAITLLEALLVALIGGMAAREGRDPLLAGTTAGTTCLVLLLPLLAGRFRRALEGGCDLAGVRSFEQALERVVWAASAGIGLMAAVAILRFDDPLVHLALIALALGSTMTNVRDHFRPAVPFGKTVALLAPPSIASVSTGEAYYQLLGMGGLIAIKLTTDICLELYRSSLTLQLSLAEKQTLARELQEKAEELHRLQGQLIQTSRLSAMGAMGSALAHELNQPLTAIANYARGSRRLLVDPSPQSIAEAVEGVAAAEAGALRAGEIVRRIRGLVAGGEAIRRPEDLGQIVREAVEFACADGCRGVECQVELPLGQLFVSADAVQIQQVLINLVRNGFEAAAQSGRPHVRVTARRETPMAEVCVADNGPGLAGREAEEMFTPFRSTKKEGMGIGLAISRAIVEAHGGRIWSMERPEGGAEFRFTVPLEQQLRSAAA